MLFALEIVCNICQVCSIVGWSDWIISLEDPQLPISSKHFSWASFSREQYCTLQNEIEEVKYNYKTDYQELFGRQIGFIQYVDLISLFHYSISAYSYA